MDVPWEIHDEAMGIRPWLFRNESKTWKFREFFIYLDHRENKYL